MGVCVYTTCVQMPREASRGGWVSWRWSSYGQFWASQCGVLRIELVLEHGPGVEPCEENSECLEEHSKKTRVLWSQAKTQSFSRKCIFMPSLVQWIGEFTAHYSITRCLLLLMKCLNYPLHSSMDPCPVLVIVCSLNSWDVTQMTPVDPQYNLSEAQNKVC